MKIKPYTPNYDNKNCLMAKGKLISISYWMTKTGAKIIFIKTNIGNFSNFENVWLSQNLDIDQLNEGDKLEIIYYVTEYQGRSYRNFVQVKLQNNEDFAGYINAQGETI